MATLQEKARKRLNKWFAKRFKYREIRAVTGVSDSVLFNIYKTANYNFTDDTAKAILNAKEPQI